jgi:thiamine biosynthesis lipoprotein
MAKKAGRFLLALLFMAVVAVLTACGGEGPPLEKGIEDTEFAMGTVVTLKIYGRDDRAILDKAFQRIHEIEKRMSVNIPSSDISRVNQNPGKDIEVHEDTFFVVEKAKGFAELSQGAFTPAILPIVKLWGIGTEDLARNGYPIPTEEQIRELLDKVDDRLIHLDRERRTIRLEKEGMGLDLGGIAKGYATDEVKRIFLEMGVESAIINMGGNVYALGKKIDGSSWRIGVRDPRSQQNKESHVLILETTDQGVITSGDYERYFIKDGIRYHHIFDARVGKPARSGVMSTTIVTDQAIDGDALSTAVFVLGPEKGLALVEELPGVEAVVVTEDKRVYATEGIAGNIDITNEEYRLQP